MERTPNKSQLTKLTLEKKILPPLPPGFELATFRSRVRRSYQKAIPAPSNVCNVKESTSAEGKKKVVLAKSEEKEAERKNP